MLLIHGGDDGVGAAHRLVSDGDGLAGLNICEAVVINYLQNFHLIQAGNRLGSFIVIYQYHRLRRGRSRWKRDRVPTTFSFSSRTG